MWPNRAHAMGNGPSSQNGSQSNRRETTSVDRSDSTSSTPWFAADNHNLSRSKSNVMDETEDGARGVDAIPAVFPCDSVFEEMDHEFEVLSLSDIVTCMKKATREVAQVTQLKETVVRILMNHVSWDQDAFLERYYGDDLPGFFAAAGAVVPNGGETSSATTSDIDVVGSTSTITKRSLDDVDDHDDEGDDDVRPNPKKLKTESLGDCEICLMPAGGPLIKNGCGHHFCVDCWRNYLIGKIMDEGLASFIQCPASECKILVEDDFVLRLITFPVVQEKYKRRITEDFVVCHRLIKWCPSAGCSNAIKTSLVSHGKVQCVCGFVFCFSCGGDVHDPVNCEIMKIWSRKVDKEADTDNWIAKNTKECPKCNAVIEKNGGCNHMTCRVVTCRHEFCWICLGPWSEHGTLWYKCNKFDSQSSKLARDQLSSKRFEMERFLFYSNRFKNHLESLKFEDKLATSVDATIDAFIDRAFLTQSESPAIKDAVQVLTRCRRTLAYTYVFAFALQKNNECHIFEDNQRDLEMATENLSELMERRFNLDCKEKNIKVEILNRSQYCESRRRILMKHVKEGEILCTWEFLPIVDGFFAPLGYKNPTANETQTTATA